MRKRTQGEFLYEIMNIFGDSYDYSWVDYRGNLIPVTLVCLTHKLGFTKRPDHLLQGRGCPRCSNEKLSKDNRKDINQLREDIKTVHGKRFEYPYLEIEYKSIKSKITIICETHGSFNQTINAHLHQNCGCPKCMESKSERSICVLLDNLDIDYSREKKFKGLVGLRGGSLRFDFAITYDTDKIFLLEYQGPHHFFPKNNKSNWLEAHLRTVAHDKIKRDYCNANNISLETIDYNQSIEKEFEKISEKYFKGVK